MQAPDSFITITQRLNSDNLLTQYLQRYESGESTTLFEATVQDRLLLGISLSPNDQFVATEEAVTPVVYDTMPLNSKPSLGLTYLRDAKTGKLVRTIEGFDVIWR